MSYLRVGWVSVVLACGCGETLSPELHAVDLADDLNDLQRPEPDGTPAENKCDVAAVAAGQALYVAFVLPEGVPDPSDPVELSVETECDVATATVAFADGLAVAPLTAPVGIGNGAIVRAEHPLGSATCIVVGAAGPACADETDSDDDG
jgi:hypothetical protein